MAGAILGDCIQVARSVFVAGAKFGEVQMSPVLAGALPGKIRNDSRRARKVTSVMPGRLRTDQFMLGLWSDRPLAVNYVSAVFCHILKRFFSYDSCCSEQCD